MKTLAELEESVVGSDDSDFDSLTFRKKEILAIIETVKRQHNTIWELQTSDSLIDIEHLADQDRNKTKEQWGLE
jgi:hypothetical protein